MVLKFENNLSAVIFHIKYQSGWLCFQRSTGFLLSTWCFFLYVATILLKYFAYLKLWK